MIFLPTLNPPVVSNVINGATDPRTRYRAENQCVSRVLYCGRPSQPWASTIVPLIRLHTGTTHWINGPKAVPINTDSTMQRAVIFYCKATMQRTGHHWETTAWFLKLVLYLRITTCTYAGDMQVRLRNSTFLTSSPYAGEWPALRSGRYVSR
jgi:hypothetical protein